MKVFYYYYYLFYKKFLDPDPQLAATLAITTLESFFLIAICDITCAKLFCFEFNKYYMIATLAIILLANSFYFFTSKNVKVILKDKPKFFNSHGITIVIVLAFSLIIISTLFWTGDYTNHILDRCR